MNGREEVLVKTNDVSVRILTLAPGEIAPWHFHQQVVDNMFCLSGRIAVDFQESGERQVLEPGDRCEVRTGRVHRVVNLGDQPAEYLLVQGVGTYDFNIVR